MLPRPLTRLAGVRPELALALLVLAARLWVLWYAGSPLPYYDQWIAEFHNTFFGIENGSSLWHVLFLRHNEHLLVTTKLLTLAGFAVNGYWDVYFLDVAAAFARAAEAALLFRLLARNSDRAGQVITWVACAGVFVGPTSGYNLLCGLQICFALVELAVIAAIWTVVRWTEPWSSGAGLVLATAAGVLSLGSAVAIPIVAALVHLADRRPRPGFWIAWMGSLGVVALFAHGLAQGAGSVSGAGHWTDQALFFLKLAGWPTSSALFGGAMMLGVAAIAFRCWLANEPASTPMPAILGLLAYAGASAAMLASSRAPADFHLRHWDSIALIPLTTIVLVTNLALLTPRFAIALRWLTGGLAAVYLAAFAVAVWRPNFAYLRDAREHRSAALAYHRGLLLSSRLVDEATGVSTTLDRAGQAFFDDPILRFTPHRGNYTAIARAPLKALSLLSPDVVPLREPSFVSRLTKLMIRFGGWLVLPGLVLAIAGLTGKCPRPIEDTPLAA